MRVAVVAEESIQTDDSLGDPSRTNTLAGLLSKRGHDVRVYCKQWWEGTPSEFTKDGITYHALSDEENGSSRRFAVRLPAALKSFDPEIIQTTETNPLAVLYAALANQVLRVPLVVDWYDVPPTTDLQQFFRRKAVRPPDTIITPSQLVQTKVNELGRDPRTLEIIPNCIDMELIRETETASLGDIVYSRSLDPYANLESFLLGLAELRDYGWEATVIGDGPDRERYEQHARDLRIDDRINFIGNQSLERRIAIFKGAHVAVHTETYTPFPTDFLRALACGCVGIAEYQTESSAHELVVQRPRGYRTTSESELAQAIEQAGDLEKLEIDESYASYDNAEFLDQFISCYRRLQSKYGML